MLPVSIVGLFCQDIREEVGGTQSLIGVMSDNMEVPSMPGMITRMALFIRVNFDPSSPPNPIPIRLVFPDGSEIPFAGVTDQLIAEASSAALTKGNVLAGIKINAVLAGLQFATGGNIRVLASVDGNEYPCAALTIRHVPPAETISPTDAPPPS